MDATPAVMAAAPSAFDVKVAALLVIYLFLPLTALSYYVFRRHRRQAKVERILRVLEVDERDARTYAEPYPGRFLLLAVLYCSLVALVGLAALMFNEPVEASLGIGSTQGRFPADDSVLMLGMAFLGAYLWGAQYVFRRYMVDDLNPGVFYGLSVRMLLAGTVAVVAFNAYEALPGNGQGGIEKSVWPALAFVLGMFPRRGLAWLRERLPFLSPESDPSVRPMPLEMIEGISIHDRLRLEECDIDNCYDLATTDFVPLALDTPYSARSLIDWMLQAKLCIYCGDAMADLRRNGIRTIVDLESLTPEQLDLLVQESAVTRSALEQAMRYLERSTEVWRLRKIGHLLGIFANAVKEPEAPAGPGENIWHAVPERSVDAPVSRPPSSAVPPAE